MKYVLLYTLFLMSVFHTSCGQNRTEVKKNIIKSETKDTVTSNGSHLIYTYVPLRMVSNIRQERNGSILIAGTNSLFGGAVFRYDGKSYTNLTDKLGLQRFWDVLEDRRGNLWFASLDSGVYYYNGKSFQHFTTREGLANNAVMCIYEDKAGNIWFGGSGLSRYDGKSFRNFTTKERFSNNDITTIIEDKTGKLWIGTKTGEAFVYDEKSFTRLIHEGQAFYNVWSIIEDKNGNIWFRVNGGRDKGLWRYDGSTFTNVSQRGVNAIVEDKKGNIWTTRQVNPGGNGGVWALSRYDQKSLYNKKTTVTEIMLRVPVSTLLGLFAADDGSIWINTSEGVLCRYDGNTLADFKSKAGQQ
ncbi:hypothetical protein A4H97_32580 [Niastella yeongjuensis]|uniref:Histidine kinase n=1 Tax=Niastella yeongjuensis TaxID=354355 RepID=A0A1V9EGK9_9BACT|nr:two-component regulator propeller domain-containing protein [Niastella yeongjuensis]OQP45256.1 hypothetical protein A4H97_32580 [Niastella yeongjuensis]SEO28156.1 Two component regulator propeller [Niastella yeongjuensis]